MKVSFDFSNANNCTRVTAEPKQYDVAILAPVDIFAVPYMRNSDRLHVSAALLFHREISGPLELSEEHICSRHVAIQISRYFDPVDVCVVNQSYAPQAIPGGRFIAALNVTLSRANCKVTCDEHQGDMLLRFVPEGVGSMFSEFEVTIGTSLMQGHGSLDSSLDEVTRLIGAAVPFCEELEIAGIRLPGGWLESASVKHLQRIADLLSTIGLTLEWQD